MAIAQTETILGHIRGLIEAEKTRGLPDAELLRRFAENHEEAAFGSLMRRHGELVWGLCRRLLRSHADAEDAFQATFLVLARQAGSIKKPEAVGSWLYGVAYRVAMKAKKNDRRRQRQERRTQPPPSPSIDVAWRELQAILDEEVQRLPERYRAPFVFCCLESRTREEAMHVFGCRAGTLSSRIARARKMLETRLARRGVTLSAAVCAYVLWSKSAAAALPATLARATVKAAVATAHGGVDGLSAAAVALARSGTSVAIVAKARFLPVLVLCVSVLTAGVCVWAFPGSPALSPEGKTKEPAEEIPKPRKDLFGDPLPPGALARLGTVRQRAPNSDIAVTADGKEIVTYGRNTIRRFDAATGELRQVSHLPLPKEMSSLPALLSPRGTFLLFKEWGQAGGARLFLWNLAQAKQVETLAVEKSSVLQGVFSADESTVALTGMNSKTNSRVVIWNLKTSKSQEFSVTHGEEQKASNVAVVLSPDGKRVAAFTLDGILRCWDVEHHKLLWESEKKLGYPIMCFSPDGKQLVSPSGYCKPEIDIRDAATGEFLAKDKKTPDEACFPLGFSPDGKFLLYQNGREEFVVWDPTADKAAFTSPAPKRRPPSKYRMMRSPLDLADWAFTPDGKALIRRCDTLQRWDLTTGKAAYADTDDKGHAEGVQSVAFSPDGKLLASGSWDRTGHIWDVATCRSLHTFASGGAAHIAFTPDGKRLLALPVMSFDPPAIAAWDVATGKENPGYGLVERKDFTKASTDRELRVTPDGKKILLLTWKGNPRDHESMLTVWNAATRECLVHKRVPWNEEGIITPDSESVLTMEFVNGFATGKVELFDIATEKARWSVAPVPRATDLSDTTLNWSLAVSPQGRLFACSINLQHKKDDRYEIEDHVFVGDLATGRERMKLQTAYGVTMAFSDDERLFVVAADEGIRLFETASWREVGTIKMPAAADEWPGYGWIREIAISPDGRTIATGHSDSNILLWDATLRAGASSKPMTATQADSLWTDLAGKDDAVGYAAIWRLVDDPERAIALLKDRLAPRPPAPEKMRALLNDLDNDDFEVRESAEKKLTDLGEAVAPALRTALKSSPSAEKKRRLESLLGAIDSEGPLAGPGLRAARAVQILERIGSADARALLKKLAEGAEESRTTKTAKQALERLEK